MENYINNKKSVKIIKEHLNILYIEDERNIREKLKEAIKLIVSNVYDCEDISQAKEILDKHRIDIIISDINLKNENALEFIKNIRKYYLNLPIILLSAYTEKNYLLEAAKLKLVDYLVKPIDFKILNNTIDKAAQELIQYGNYIVDFENKTSYNILNKKLLSKETKKDIILTAKEIELLEYFISNSNRVLSHDEIKNKLWIDSYEITDSALKNLINKLRKKIGKESIKNISGVGFKIELI
ncbi:transcriptional regulator [Arcobacter sp. CECT 8983]|uniref:response regulator transcription factor n=1 Tax=Arcobacter sp. CECT 8983 TaxID=2044508 RepID=UPI00100B60FA|nr:response regulator transcription factor [Arcobacter sp. CECT 8983]RXJ89410.1 transcriptional regulator [Arcobacter sp. CECT 8983]